MPDDAKPGDACPRDPKPRDAGPRDARLPIDELHALEAQVAAQPAAENGTLSFLKDGMLVVIRAAIAAEAELARRGG